MFYGVMQGPWAVNENLDALQSLLSKDLKAASHQFQLLCEAVGPILTDGLTIDHKSYSVWDKIKVKFYNSCNC